jgi:hypothetical protein
MRKDYCKKEETADFLSSDLYKMEILLEDEDFHSIFLIIWKEVRSFFFFSGYIPSQLPVSCLTVAPRADKLEKAVGRKPLLEVNIISEFNISARQYALSNFIHCGLIYQYFEYFLELQGI